MTVIMLMVWSVLAVFLITLLIGLWQAAEKENSAAQKSVGYWTYRADHYKKAAEEQAALAEKYKASMEYWHENDKKLTYENKDVVKRAHGTVAEMQHKLNCKKTAFAVALTDALMAFNDGKPVKIDWEYVETKKL